MEKEIESSLRIGEINIEIIRKDIKNMHLSVHPPNGRVRLAVPLKMQDEAVRLFAISKLPWIRKQQLRYDHQERVSPREYVSGESHYFAGDRYLLNVIETNKGRQRVEVKNKKQMELFVRPGSDTATRERVMQQFYRDYLKSEIPSMVAEWEPVIEVRVNEWGVKRMKTKWGTCNDKAKRIWVNLELGKKNPRCLEYIVVHEMVHLLERHHNDRFKAYLDKFLPNWRNVKDELNGIIFDK